MIDQMCERDLADKFVTSFDLWNKHARDLDLVLLNYNENDFLTQKLNFDVIDFAQFAGVNISRRKNREEGI